MTIVIDNPRTQNILGNWRLVHVCFVLKSPVQSQSVALSAWRFRDCKFVSIFLVLLVVENEILLLDSTVEAFDFHELVVVGDVAQVLFGVAAA
tara:strand:- start:785 stop:1063 length:279 start_codon:yes stop_codon:yes gene_type:complete